METQVILGLALMAGGGSLALSAEQVVAAMSHYDQWLARNVMGMYVTPAFVQTQLALYVNRFAGLSAVLVGLAWMFGLVNSPLK